MFSSTTGGAAEPCPASFETQLGEFPGCYKTQKSGNGAKSWASAVDACQELDTRAHLISVETQQVSKEMSPGLAVFTASGFHRVTAAVFFTMRS